MTTDEQRAAWRRVTEAATPGPWYNGPDDLIGGFCVGTEDSPPSRWTAARLIADFPRQEDAAFIAAARNALPALLADADTLARVRTELKAGLEGEPLAAMGRVLKLIGGV